MLEIKDSFGKVILRLTERDFDRDKPLRLEYNPKGNIDSKRKKILFLRLTNKEAIIAN